MFACARDWCAQTLCVCCAHSRTMCLQPLCLHLVMRRHLVVDGPTLAALDIFREEEHPSAMGIGASKEGVSLFGLLQRCVTGMVRAREGGCHGPMRQSGGLLMVRFAVCVQEDHGSVVQQS